MSSFSIEHRVPAVVVGDLNLARCLGIKKVPVIAVSSFRFVPYSRYCKKGIFVPAQNDDRLFEALAEIGSREHEKPILFYLTNDDLCLISRRRGELSKYYRFLMPDENLVEDLTNKQRFNCLAEIKGLPAPKTIVFRRIEELERHLDDLPFPCIAKPAEHGSFEQVVNRAYGRVEKGVYLEDWNVLRRFCLAFKKEEEQDLLLQEYIPGGADAIFSFHGFFDEASRPLAYFVGRKIRTYPSAAGYSSCLTLVRDPDVIQVGLHILSGLKFKGPAKVDFKKDPRTGKLFILEINPRFNLWHYLGSMSGINIPYLAYQYLCGGKVEPLETYRTDKVWISFSRDCKAFIEQRRLGNLSLFSWLKSYGPGRVHDVFSWRDPLPWVVSILGTIRRWIRVGVAG